MKDQSGLPSRPKPNMLECTYGLGLGLGLGIGLGLGLGLRLGLGVVILPGRSGRGADHCCLEAGTSGSTLRRSVLWPTPAQPRPPVRVRVRVRVNVRIEVGVAVRIRVRDGISVPCRRSRLRRCLPNGPTRTRQRKYPLWRDREWRRHLCGISGIKLARC